MGCDVGGSFSRAAELVRIEQVTGNQPLFLDEPHEHEPREQADQADFLAAIVGRLALGERNKFRLGAGPGEPVRQFGVEALVEFRRRERFDPAIIKVAEIGRGLLARNGGKRKVCQNFDMGAVRDWQGQYP